MTSLRAAVLIFLIGASLGNFFAVKEGIDRMGPGPGPPPTPTPSAAPSQTYDPVVAEIMGRTSGGYSAAVAARNAALSPIYDRGWMREAVIVTIAGVAWFVIRSRTV